MASTTYEIFAGGESKGTKSKKATAVEFARELRDELKVAVEVKTSTGNTVFELAAPKKIKMSPRYTRTVELPEGVAVPAGQRVAYFRPRVGLALLHDPAAAEGKQYSFLNTKTGKVLKQRFATTREAGQAFVTVAKEAKAAKQPEGANA